MKSETPNTRILLLRYLGFGLQVLMVLATGLLLGRLVDQGGWMARPLQR
jgi:uncharacterized membrane protein YdcZ (DUF606 family)